MLRIPNLAGLHFETTDIDRKSIAVERSKFDPTHQVLEKVVIPSSNRGSVGSSLSSVRAQSSEFDTPATSAMVTPAESLAEGRCEEAIRSAPSVTETSKNAQKGKRKHPEVDELMASDTLLAQALQEEEYKEDQSAKSQAGVNRRHMVEDSEDDDTPLSDLTWSNSSSIDDLPAPKRLKAGHRMRVISRAAGADFSDDGALSEADAPFNKESKAGRRSSLLPSRAARNSANQPFRNGNYRGILDSEDSELSEQLSNKSAFASDSDSDEFEGSDTFIDNDDEDHDHASLNSNNIISPGTAAISGSSNWPTTAAQRRRHRGRPARTDNTTRIRRSIGNRRAGDRVSIWLFVAKCFYQTDLI